MTDAAHSEVGPVEHWLNDLPRSMAEIHRRALERNRNRYRPRRRIGAQS